MTLSVTFESTTYTDTLFECSSFAIDLQTTFKKMRKFDKMFLDDVFYNLNSLHKIENGDAPQMQHQVMFHFKGLCGRTTVISYDRNNIRTKP